MKHAVEQIVSRYARAHLDQRTPLLVALSGGPDSRALLALLLKVTSIPLAVAHVDHGWREESGAEAHQLEQLASELGLTYHLIRLDGDQVNSEVMARCARYRFFAQLCRDHHYQGVAVAHHADDQAETLLKRLFEGASLPLLAAMAPERQVEGVMLFRPLLTATKAQLQHWNRLHEIDAFDDPTNHTSIFLRGRMRHQLLPTLAEQFGKEIAAPLVRLSGEAAELADFIDVELAPYLAKTSRGPWGCCLSSWPDHPFLIRQLLRLFCSGEDVALSHVQVKQLAGALKKRHGNSRTAASGKQVIADRGRLFIISLPSIGQQRYPINSDLRQVGSWQVELLPVPSEVRLLNGWRHAWEGELSISLPAGDYSLGGAAPSTPYCGHSSLSKLWNNGAVPIFFKEFVPVVWKNGAVVHEFLSGKVTLEGETLLVLKSAK